MQYQKTELDNPFKTWKDYNLTKNLIHIKAYYGNHNDHDTILSLLLTPWNTSTYFKDPSYDKPIQNSKTEQHKTNLFSSRSDHVSVKIIFVYLPQNLKYETHPKFKVWPGYQ